MEYNYYQHKDCLNKAAGILVDEATRISKTLDPKLKQRDFNNHVLIELLAVLCQAMIENLGTDKNSAKVCRDYFDAQLKYIWSFNERIMVD